MPNSCCMVFEHCSKSVEVEVEANYLANNLSLVSCCMTNLLKLKTVQLSGSIDRPLKKSSASWCLADRIYLYIMNLIYLVVKVCVRIFWLWNTWCLLTVNFLRKQAIKYKIFPFLTFFLVSPSCNCIFTSNCGLLSKESIRNKSYRKQMVLPQIFALQKNGIFLLLQRKFPYFTWLVLHG